jgi:hypothetical protein
MIDLDSWTGEPEWNTMIDLDSLVWTGEPEWKLARAGMFGQVIILYNTLSDRYDIYHIGLPGQKTKEYSNIEPVIAQSVIYHIFRRSPWAWWKGMDKWFYG